jgi:hypothetical protein
MSTKKRATTPTNSIIEAWDKATEKERAEFVQAHHVELTYILGGLKQQPTGASRFAGPPQSVIKAIADRAEAASKAKGKRGGVS